MKLCAVLLLLIPLPLLCNEKCGSCVCIRSIHSIICEGIHIFTLETIPTFYRNYTTLVIRDTAISKLPENICTWKVKSIIIRNNKKLKCSSVKVCKNINIDSDCLVSTKFSSETTQSLISDFTTSIKMVKTTVIETEQSSIKDNFTNGKKTTTEIIYSTDSYSSIKTISSDSVSSQSFTTKHPSTSSGNFKTILGLSITASALLFIVIVLGSYVFSLKKKTPEMELSLNTAFELEDIGNGVANPAGDNT